MNRFAFLFSAMLAVLPELLVPLPLDCFADEGDDRVSEYTLESMTEEGELETLKLQGPSALNWSNPVFGTTDGGLFIWCSPDQRPAVVMKTYKTKKGVWFEQTRSLSVNRIIAKDKDQAVFWSPSRGVEPMKRLPGAPEPAASSRARLRQMKALHRRFRVTGDLPAAGGKQMLRNYPTPLYRYSHQEGSSESGPKAGWLEGGVFGFVQGTGPDVILMLEVRSDGEQPKWHYRLGAIGIFAIEVELDGKLVWSEDRRTAAQTKPSELYDGRRL